MGTTKIFSVYVLLTLFLSCSPNKTPNTQGKSNEDTLERDEVVENITLSVADTIKKTASCFFSNTQTKDVFLLTIEPGLVKDSKSSLQIITSDKRIIYTQSFDTYYFIKWIYEPDTIPSTGGQEAFEKYMENYRKSITPARYEAYFKKSVDNFFPNAMSFLDKTKLEELEEFGGELNKDFLNEYLLDTTIQLVDIACFDCDEGAAVVGYSKIQNKVITLFEHD